MIVGVAGSYSAPTAAQREKNLEAINIAAAMVYAKGHIPFVGVNMALPVVANADMDDEYRVIMDISMAVIDKCDAILLIAESPGANRERDMVLAKGLPVYHSIDEVPENRH